MPDRQFVWAKMPAIARNIKGSEHTALTTALNGTLSALDVHPLMAHPSSSHLTPPPLFYVYDFVQRTVSILAQISVDDLTANERGALEQWNDCVGRCCMARLMIEGKIGKAAELLGGSIDFGEQVREAVVRAAVVGGEAGNVEEDMLGSVNDDRKVNRRETRSRKKSSTVS